MVGARCAVASCNNSYTIAKKRGHVLSLHCFPKDLNLKEFWMGACARGDAWNPDTSFICSDHFALEDFISDQRLQLWTGVKWRPQLKPGAIPTRNLPKTKCSKYKIGHNHTRESLGRFSMFEVLSIELGSRLGKVHEDIHDTPEDNTEPNVGNTGSSENVEAGQTHKESSTGPPSDSTGTNQVNTSTVIASDGNHEITAAKIRLDIRNTDSDSENDNSHKTEIPSCPPKKPRINDNRPACTESPSRNRNTTDWEDSPSKQIHVDFSARESRLSPVNTKIIYSCPAFELFLDNEK